MKLRVTVGVVVLSVLLLGCNKTMADETVYFEPNLGDAETTIDDIEASDLTFEGRVTVLKSRGDGVYPFSVVKDDVLRYGFIDRKHNKIIQPIYENILDYYYSGSSVDFIPAKYKGKWGYINRLNGDDIEFTYDYVKPFIGDYAIYRKDNKYGVVDNLGIEALPAAYDDIYATVNNILVIKNGEKYGFYCPEEKFFAQNRYLEKFDIEGDYIIGLKTNGKYELITTGGQVLKVYDTKPRFSKQSSDEGETILIFYGDDTISGVDKIVEDEVEVVIEAGEQELYAEYYYINYRKPIKDDQFKTGFYDFDGNEVKVNDQALKRVYGIYNGMQAFKAEDGFGYRDEQGHVVIPPTYRQGDFFTENGLAVVTKKDGKEALIDKMNNSILEAEEIIKTADGKDFYLVYQDDNKQRLYNSATQEFCPVEAVSYCISDEFIYVILDEKLAVLDFDYNTIVDFQENADVALVDEGYLIKGDQWAYYLTDLKGNKTHEGTYDEIESLDEFGFRLAVDNNKTYLLNDGGRRLVQRGFEKIITLSENKVLLVDKGTTSTTFIIKEIKQ